MEQYLEKVFNTLNNAMKPQKPKIKEHHKATEERYLKQFGQVVKCYYCQETKRNIIQFIE